MAQTLPTLDEVQKGIVDLYIAYFNRAPETKGLNDWTNYFYTQAAQGKDPDAIYKDMANQFFGLGFHFQALPPNLQTDNTALVKWAYQNVLGRDLDAEAAANTPPADPKFANAAEEAYQTWVPLLDSGTLDKGSFFVTLIDVARSFKNDSSWGWVYNYLEARNDLGLLFAKSKEGNITDPNQAITVGKQVLKGLTPDQVKANPNVDPQALAQQVFTQWEASQIGQTFRLTTGADTPVLTAGNDTIDGTTTPDSLGSGDLIVDQGGTDTLNARLTKAWTASPTVVGVENVNLNLDMYSTPTLDVGGIKGATITLSTSKVITGDATVSNAGNNTIVAGSGFTGKLTASGVTTGTILADQAKSVDVTGTSGADTINVVAGANTTSITVDGSGGKDTLNLTLGHDATLTLSNFSDSGETVNLTAAGNATVTVSGGAKVLNVLGSGDVTIKGNSTVFSGNTVTDQNAGKLDIVVTDSSGVSSLDASKLQADSISLTAGSSASLTGADGQNFIVAASGGNVTFDSDPDTADTLNVKLTSKNYGTITGSGDNDTLVLTAAAPSGSGADLTISKLVGPAAVILQGANDVEISSGATGITTLDAHALEGNLKISGDTFIVSSGKETVVLGAQGDNTIVFDSVSGGTTSDTALVYTGQGGKDDITLGAITSSGSGAKDASVVLALGDGDDSVTVSDVSGAKATLAIDAGAGDDTVTLNGSYSGGTVSLTLGDGNDTLVIGSGANFSGANFAVGFGGGSGDTLELQDSANLTGFNTFNITGLETIKLDGATATIDSSLVNGKTYSVTGAGYGNSTLTVNAHDNSGDVIDLSKLNVSDSASSGAKISASGGTGADLITGTKLGDSIDGGSGDDTIIGGAGADTLTGGSGDDLFIFGSGDASAFTKLTLSGGSTIDVSSGDLTAATIDLSKIGAVDVIMDWGTGDDSIKFLNSAGSAITKVDSNSGDGVANDSVLFLQGTYSDGTFSGGSDGSDALAIYDVKAGDGVSYQAVVIVGGYNHIATDASGNIAADTNGIFHSHSS